MNPTAYANWLGKDYSKASEARAVRKAIDAGINDLKNNNYLVETAEGKYDFMIIVMIFRNKKFRKDRLLFKNRQLVIVKWNKKFRKKTNLSFNIKFGTVSSIHLKRDELLGDCGTVSSKMPLMFGTVSSELPIFRNKSSY